ncbi:hypothetical protein [Sporosarcina sp. NPDC096371]|uniref:hypothetical protein n=1 Tax=Sporosarcina sp. NPDC096371 TaxID=3364530 RepID=UPI0037F216BA
MAKRKQGLLLISSSITVYLLVFAMGKYDTSAWFVSETNASGSLENATTEDLLVKTAEVISYETGGVVSVNVEVTNIFDVDIPIQLEEYDVNLAPGDTFSEVIQQQVPLDATEINLQLTGFRNYINESLTIPVDPALLLETIPVEPEEEPEIDDAQPDKPESEVPDEKDKGTVPEELEKPTGSENIDKITKPGDIDKITPPDKQVEVDSHS